MDTPIIKSILSAPDAADNNHFVKGDKGNARMLRLLAEAVTTILNGVADRKIYNIEYQDAYDRIRSAAEHAFDVQGQKNLDEFRKASETWNRKNDPRMALWYHPAFNNIPGAVKRLQKYANDPLVASMMPVFLESSQLLEICKQAKAFVVKGRRPNLNKTEAQVTAELSNTGVCAICSRRQKMDANQKMVMHGYQMSEYNHAGYRIGKCFGVGYAPYELSNEANVAFKPILATYLRDHQLALETLKSGEITSVEVTREGKWNGRGYDKVRVVYTLEANPYEFKREMENRIYEVEHQISLVTLDIKNNDAMITNWTLQPLKYGTK